MAGFGGPVGFGNLGRPGGPAKVGPGVMRAGGPPGFPQGGPVGFGNLGHGGPVPQFAQPRLGIPLGFKTPDSGFSLPPTSGAHATPQNASPPSALDSTYYQQLGDATLAANNKINAYNQQSGYAGVDLQNALAQLNYQQGLQTQNAQNAENSRGGFALGHLGQALGQLNHAYLDRGSQDQLTYGRGQAARDAAVAAVRQGLSIEQAALAAAAADRASANAAKNPALGQSSAPLTPGAAPSATPAPGTEGATLPQHPGGGGLPPVKPGFTGPVGWGNLGRGRLTVQQALNRSNSKFRPTPHRSSGYGIVRGGG